jgi:hypothetical protein
MGLAVPARLVIQHRRGTLNWDRETPVLVAAPLIVLSLVAITGAGSLAQLIVPPLIILGGAIWLLLYTQWNPSPPSAKTLRRIGYAALVGGGFQLGAALLRVLAR